MWQTVYTLIRPAFCRVWSGSISFPQACLSQYLRLLQYFSSSRPHTVNRHNYFPPCDVVIQINALFHYCSLNYFEVGIFTKKKKMNRKKINKKSKKKIKKNLKYMASKGDFIKWQKITFTDCTSSIKATSFPQNLSNNKETFIKSLLTTGLTLSIQTRRPQTVQTHDQCLHWLQHIHEF